ncbi:MAG: hypothetical protein R6X31_13295 [Anaerolineae bacterium]|nr:hypothetical protein [Chloroflexota bacterium]
MAGLDERHIAKAKRLVAEKFPEMAGAKPSVSRKRLQCKGTAEGAHSAETRYVLTFERDVFLPGGSEMKRLVRVTMDDSGEIIRFSSSK